MTGFIITIVCIFSVWVVFELLKLLGLLGTLLLFVMPLVILFLIIKFSNDQVKQLLEKNMDQKDSN